MNVPNIRWDRLGILLVGTRRLALPLSDVAYFARAGQRQAVSEGPRWLVGVLHARETPVWLPIVDLALLWADTSLSGVSARSIATHAGIALEIDDYTTTREALPILPLRPAPGHPALRRATLLDGQPIPVLDVYHLLTAEHWASLTPTTGFSPLEGSPNEGVQLHAGEQVAARV